MKTILSVMLRIMTIPLFCGSLSATENLEVTGMESKITESYVMLYYRDMTAPRHFYADILGLEASFQDDWVSLYKLTATSYIGVVKEGGNAYHKVQKTNAVMLSIVVDNVDLWYNRVKANPDVPVLKEIHNSDNVPIRAFLIKDPGGYTVELFQWLNK